TKENLWSKIEYKYKNQDEMIEKKKKEIISNLHGIDKDLFLAKICKLYLEILSGGTSKIFCEDSLDPQNYRSEAKNLIENGKFEYIFTNPPFGSKIPIDDKDVLKTYELGHTWKNVSANNWEKQKTLVKKHRLKYL
ncbi:unnamed protein product, partial [marine sediment metagenome]